MQSDMTAVFIDGAYFNSVRDLEFNRARLDYGRLARALAGDHPFLRAYYYDAEPWAGDQADPIEAEKQKKKRSFLNALRMQPRFEVRLGRMSFRGPRSEDERPRFEQKQVNMLLGVDLTLMAAKRQIGRAIVVSGDSDFVPAVEAAKREGVLVHLWHGRDCAPALWDSCDERSRFDGDFIDALLRDEFPHDDHD